MDFLLKKWQVVLPLVSLVILGLLVSVTTVFAISEFWLIKRLGPLFYGIHGLVEGNSPHVFKFAPNSKIMVRGVAGAINNQSLRRRENSDLALNPPSHRLLVYGDSIAFGVGVKDEETFPSRLEALLNKNAPSSRYEVLNAARGHSPTIYSFHLQSDLIEFSPQVVIVQIELLNDISDEATTSFSGRDEDGLPVGLTGARYILGFGGQSLSVFSMGFPVIERSLSYGHLIRRIGNLGNRIFPNPVFSETSRHYYYSLGFDNVFLTEKRLRRGYDEMFATLGAMSSLLKKRQREFLLLIMPSRFSFYENQFRETSLRWLKDAESSARALNIPHVSLFKGFSRNGGKDLFMDFCHPHAKGYEIVAAELAEYFVRKLEREDRVRSNS